MQSGSVLAGAAFLQDRYKARVVVPAEDWHLMDRTSGSWKKPHRDIVAKDGHQVTLGDTTLTLHQTPGHTLGTFSKTKLPAMAKRQAGEPHPYVIGPAAVARCLTVAEECALAGRARVL